MHCRFATSKDLEEVVSVHSQAFPNFFLSKLGSKFLYRMYRAFLESGHSIFIVSVNDSGNVTGFAVGMLKNGPSDLRFALRFFPSFAIAVLPSLIFNPGMIFNRLFAMFSGLTKSSVLSFVPSNSLLLKSIGILPSLRGCGVGATLIRNFEICARKKKVSQIVLTTDEHSNDRALHFYNQHGYSVINQFLQGSNRSMLILSKHVLLSSNEDSGV